MSSTPPSRRIVEAADNSTPTEFDRTDTGWMFRTLLANIDGMVYRCRDDADWTMEFVSEGSARVTGYHPRDLMYNGLVSYESITHPEDQLWVREATRNAVDTRSRFDLEYRIVHKD